MTENNEEILDQLAGPAQVMESWGITGSIEYSESGSLLLSGRLGEAVVRNDFSAFLDALESGKSEEGLTYQDMADFNQFSSEWFLVGEAPGPGGSYEYSILVRRQDKAPFGFELPAPECNLEPSWEDDERGFIWEFVPMNPFTIQGYEPA